MRRLSWAGRASGVLLVCAFATLAPGLSTVTAASTGPRAAGLAAGCSAQAASGSPTVAICHNDPFVVTWIEQSRLPTARTIATPARVRLVVKFDRRLGARARTAALKRLGLTSVQALPQLGAVVASLPAASARTALVRIAGSPDVAYAERDETVHAALAPDDPYFAPFDGSTSNCASSLLCWVYHGADLAPAWDVTTGSSAVTVAVLDTGVDPSQPDLAGALLTGCNLVSGSVSAGVCSDTDTSDDYGHGTEAAGVIGARINNGIGVPGVCGQCRILPVKVLDQFGSGSTSNIALGITWAADHGAQIINLSLAGGNADPLERDAISYAISQGVLVVAAAGNGGSNSPTTFPGGYPAAFTSFPDTSGGAPITSGLIAVGATDYSNNVFSFSNYGSWVTVTAPGCSPAVLMDGTFDAGTRAFCGTSAASPFVAGAAALLLSYDPGLTPAQLQTDITSSATPVTQRMLSSGGGVACGGGSPCSQSGELDAYGALTAAGYSPPPIAPSNLDAPSLSGSTIDGQTLAGSQGNWMGSPTISYSFAWDRCDSAGADCSATGTTATNYTLAAADVSHTLKFTVTATNGVGSTTASVTSGIVAALAPSVLSGPTVVGGSTPTLGSMLTASHGSWSGTATISYGYTWQRSPDNSSWTDIADANASTYVVVSNDQDNYLRVRVTASNAGGSVDAYSVASGQVIVAPANVVLPTVSGTVRAQEPLAAATGSWSGSAASYSYQWQSSGNGSGGWANIASETGPSYEIRLADVGDYLRVVVSSINAAGSDSASSAATAQVRGVLVTPTSTALPLISGGAAVGELLVASTGNWTGSPSSFSFQWSASTDGLSWSNIVGAAAGSYTVQPGDLGEYLRVSVTALTDSGGTAQADSAATGQVVSPGAAGGGGGSGAVAADFRLLLSSDQATAVQGGQIIWRLTVSDRLGTAAASGVNVTITLPSGLSFAQATADRGPGCTPSGQTVTCNLDYVAPGLDGHVILWTQVNAAGDQTLTAAVRHNGPEANPSDDQASLTVAGPPTTVAPTVGPPKATPAVSFHATITGRPLVGRKLSLKTGGNARVVGYQWQICHEAHQRLTCKALTGARSRTLDVRARYAGSRLRAVVTYLDGKHHDRLTTATTATVKA